MRRLRIMSICLGVVLALAAVAASTATAAGPAFGQCYAKEGGKYTNANCTSVPAKKLIRGSYEWRNADEIPTDINEAFDERELFSGAVPSSVTLEAEVVTCEPGERVLQPSCAAGESESHETITVECGEIDENLPISPSGEAVERAALTLWGCNTMGGALACSNAGAPEAHGGKIITEALKGTVGYIDKEKNEVGITLEPEYAKADLVRFTCGPSLSLAIGGASSKKEGPAYQPKGGGDAIVTQISPVNEMAGGYGSGSGFQHVYAFNEQLENLPTHLEGKPVKALEAYEFNAEEPTKGSKWSKAGIGLTVGLSDGKDTTPYGELELRD